MANFFFLVTKNHRYCKKLEEIVKKHRSKNYSRLRQQDLLDIIGRCLPKACAW